MKNLVGKHVTYTNRRGHVVKATVLEQPTPDSVKLLVKGWPEQLVVGKEFVRVED